jgi:hypothetical protein
MQVRISDEALLPDLLEYLGSQVDAVVARVGPDRLEANILGYGLEGAQMELDLRLRAWQAAHPGVVVEQVPGRAPLRAVEPDER